MCAYLRFLDACESVSVSKDYLFCLGVSMMYTIYSEKKLAKTIFHKDSKKVKPKK